MHIRDVDPHTVELLKKLAAMHHRSMQGELKSIISEAVRKVSDAGPEEELDLVTVSTGNRQPWSRSLSQYNFSDYS